MEGLYGGGFGCFLFLPAAKGDDAALFGPLFILGGHCFDVLGVFGGEVVHLGAVGGDVVEFPLTLDALGDDFPCAIADGTVAFVLEVDGLSSLDGFAFEGGIQGSAFDGNFIGWI